MALPTGGVTPIAPPTGLAGHQSVRAERILAASFFRSLTLVLIGIRLSIWSQKRYKTFGKLMALFMKMRFFVRFMPVRWMRPKKQKETDIENVEKVAKKLTRKARCGEHLTMSGEALDMENEKSQENRQENAASEAETLQHLKG